MDKTWKPFLPPFRAHKSKVFSEIIFASKFIHQLGEYEDLRKKLKPVDIKQINSSNFRKKVAYLKSCLLQFRKKTGFGRGLTAVQVGIPESFSVIYTGQSVVNAKMAKGTSKDDLLVIINPVITKKSKRMLKYPEMCLSAYPIIIPVNRPSWIEFKYFDEKGDKKVWNTKDDTTVGVMMNRVFQHEIDHMDGVITIDRVNDSKKIILDSDPDFYSSAKFETVK